MSIVSKINEPIVSVSSDIQSVQFSRPTSVERDRAHPSPLRTLWQNLLCRGQKREGRRALRELTDVQLHDIGITRAEARREISKSFFWD
jgi:uncharacterized protein YjiS (DUF1127 family)